MREHAELAAVTSEPARAPAPEPKRRHHRRADRGAVRVTARLDASPAEAFDAWLEPAMASTWLFAMASRPIGRVEIDARVGGAYRFVDRHHGEHIEHTGVYVEIVPPRRLAFTLGMEHSPEVVTRVTAEIAPLKKGCTLTITHENVPAEHAIRTENRWAGMLYGLGMRLRARRRGE
jgi:uncharacterized protein YndB with AHSA1/START domain